MAKKAPKLSKNHDLQETDEFCKKRHKISQALLNLKENPGYEVDNSLRLFVTMHYFM
jgi:hypothetical protein